MSKRHRSITATSRRPETGVTLPARMKSRQGTSLDSWLAYNWCGGVQIDTLEFSTMVVARTQNSTYELAVVGAGGEVFVRGGRHFPDWTSARLTGCTLGNSSLLKQFGIHTGWQMEFQLNDRRILTSPVETVTLRPAATGLLA